MNGLSHQQKMMEIQHMSNACLVTLLPRVQETLQGARRDGYTHTSTHTTCFTLVCVFQGEETRHTHIYTHYMLHPSVCVSGRRDQTHAHTHTIHASP